MTNYDAWLQRPYDDAARREELYEIWVEYFWSPRLTGEVVAALGNHLDLSFEVAQGFREFLGEHLPIGSRNLTVELAAALCIPGIPPFETWLNANEDDDEQP